MKEKKWYIVRIYKTRLMGINERRVISETFLSIDPSRETGGKAWNRVDSITEMGPRTILVEYGSNRIICTSLKAKQYNINIAQVYATQQGLSEKERKNFYRDRQDTIDRMLTIESRIVIGDPSRHTGKDISL